MLTPTTFSTVADKEKFLKHFQRFVKSGYNKNLFYKWFYTRLSMTFGHIAHDNIEGFYQEFFTTPEDIERFWHQTRSYPCYGDPAYTYSDVEKVIQAHYQGSNVTFAVDMIDSGCQQ